MTKFMCSSIFQLCANDDTVIKVDYKVETAMRKRLAPDPDVFFFSREEIKMCVFFCWIWFSVQDGSKWNQHLVIK